MIARNEGKHNLQIIFIVIGVFFCAFLIFPMAYIFLKAILSDTGISLEFYKDIIDRKNFLKIFANSVSVSALSGCITTVLAFIIAYTMNYTNISNKLKKYIRLLVMLPMLLPTITYGFAIIYSFGKQGLITLIFGKQLFEIYGLNGLLIGYVIYTLPISFLLINNTMAYIDKKFSIVSKAMGDSVLRSFFSTIMLPLVGTLTASFIQSFTLSFTDYGIPASVGGNVELMSTLLYNEMLGSMPNFNTGSVVAVLMMIPSVVSFAVLSYISKYNIRYTKISTIELSRNKLRDWICGILSATILILELAIFVVIFIVPLVIQWPYKVSFTLQHFMAIIGDKSLMRVYGNSLLISIITAFFGTLIVYGAGLISARKILSYKYEKILDGISILANTIPGMVLGVAYLMAFKGTFIQNTFFIIIVCNIVHFFSSPYIMMKSGLEKLNASWETTAKLMGDSWLKTIVRIITPNSRGTILEVFRYFFINSMVTVSAVIFIAGARTMVITAKIKELQHFSNFNEIFVLSILILLTNLIVKKEI